MRIGEIGGVTACVMKDRTHEERQALVGRRHSDALATVIASQGLVHLGRPSRTARHLSDRDGSAPDLATSFDGSAKQRSQFRPVLDLIESSGIQDEAVDRHAADDASDPKTSSRI